MLKILTIIVPVFKVERYINKCLDSCIIYEADENGQLIVDDKKMNLLEVIIVNDGTPDNSSEISREYTKKYPQTFRQIDKENGGHGSAWNIGVKEASGKYIRFLDSDDWLANLNILIERLQDCDADLVFTDFTKYYVQADRYELQTLNTQFCATLPLTKEFLYSQKEGNFVLNFWRTTYKSSILRPQYPLFAEKVMYDDSILAIAPLLSAKTYIAYNFAVYNYLLGREEQTMNEKVRLKNLQSYYVCYQRQVDWLAQNQDKLSEELKICAADTVSHYARLILSYLPHLPYSEAKAKMKYYYYEGVVKSNHKEGKMIRRYEKLPFPLFYLFEQIRYKKNQM